MNRLDVAYPGKEYVGKDCTLNGERASIYGTKLEFAKVRSFESPLVGEWAWETVKHIMEDNNGEFKL